MASFPSFSQKRGSVCLPRHLNGLLSALTREPGGRDALWHQAWPHKLPPGLVHPSLGPPDAAEPRGGAERTEPVAPASGLPCVAPDQPGPGRPAPLSAEKPHQRPLDHNHPAELTPSCDSWLTTLWDYVPVRGNQNIEKTSMGETVESRTQEEVCSQKLRQKDISRSPRHDWRPVLITSHLRIYT